MKYEKQFSRLGRSKIKFVNCLVTKHGVKKATAEDTFRRYDKKYKMIWKFSDNTKNGQTKSIVKKEIMWSLEPLTGLKVPSFIPHNKMLLLESAKRFKTNLTWKFLGSIGFTPLEVKFLVDNELIFGDTE